MSEPDFHFTFHFSNFQYPLSQDTATFGENFVEAYYFFENLINENGNNFDRFQNFQKNNH